MSLDPMSSGESEKNQVEKLVKGSDCSNTSVNTENNTMVSERGMQREPNEDMDIYECFEASNNTQNVVNAFDACENVQMVSDQGSEHNIQKVFVMHDLFEGSDNIRNAVNISDACGNGQTVSNLGSENAVEMDDCFKDDDTIQNVMHASDTCENQQTVSERVSGSAPWKIIEMDECFKAFDGMPNVVGTPDACENGHTASEGLSKSRPHKVDIGMDECFEGSVSTQNVANASEEIKQIVLEQISEIEQRKAVEMVDNGGKQTTVEIRTGARLPDGDIDTDGSPCYEIPGKELGIGSASSACETEPGTNLGNQYPFDVRAGYNSGSRLLELQRNPEILLREFGENPGYRLLDDGQTKLWQECDQHSKQKPMDLHNYSLVSDHKASLINLSMQGSIDDMNDVTVCCMKVIHVFNLTPHNMYVYMYVFVCVHACNEFCQLDSANTHICFMDDEDNVGRGIYIYIYVCVYVLLIKIVGRCVQAVGKPLDTSHKQESPNQESPNQESCTTALVSTNLEGWQRFDIEDNDAQMAYGILMG